MKRSVLTSFLLLAPAALAQEAGDEVELSSAPVTALSCAKRAIETGKLDLLTACPLEETQSGLVVFDVAEMTFYRLDQKVRVSDLERAFGGGSVDITGKVTSLGKDKVAVVAVEALRVTPKPKPGAFKGCL
jgi:hypothetical protein